MNEGIIAREYLAEKEGIIPILEKIFSEKSIDILELENRWKKEFDSVFSFLARSVSRFFVSHVKSEEVTQAQSFIWRIFRSTDYTDKIRNDANLQNAFLLGYCHGVDKMIRSFEEEISYEQSDSLKSAILSYKYVEPILRILDNNFEMSHKELAEQIGISESALSNFMNKVKRYNLFNSTRVGKNKYYSLAYPNGEKALKIVKEERRISADSYTEFLLVLMDSLRKISLYDDLGKDYALKKCEKMILQYTTRPTLCKKKIEDLALILKSERFYFTSLLALEKSVKEKVTVFTRDIRSEKSFRDAIIENLRKNVIYQWFFTETNQFDSEEKVKDFFFEQFLQMDNVYDMERIRCNVYCHLIPKEESDFLLGDIYDAVIYDENKGFICEDESISDQTPYIQMQQDEIEKFNSYVKEQRVYFGGLTIR